MFSAPMEGLLALDQDLAFIPKLATEYSISDDGLSYTFTLREGVKWHNGEDFVADDVINTWKIVNNPDFGTYNTYRLGFGDRCRRFRGRHASHDLHRRAVRAVPFDHWHRAHRPIQRGSRSPGVRDRLRPRAHRHRALQAGRMGAPAADFVRPQRRLLGRNSHSRQADLYDRAGRQHAACAAPHRRSAGGQQ